MKGLSGEFMFILFVVAIILYQMLFQRRPKDVGGEAGHQQPGVPGEPEQAEPAQEMMRVPEAFGSTPPSAQPSMLAPEDLPPALPTRVAMQATPAASPNVEPRARGQYSRRALFGSRRRVREAFVAAELLGPCRAFKPHDVSQ